MAHWRLMAMALCVALLTLGAACGRKGDPIPPSSAEEIDDEEEIDAGY